MPEPVTDPHDEAADDAAAAAAASDPAPGSVENAERQQHLAARHRKRDQPLVKLGDLGRCQVAKGLDQRERGCPSLTFRLRRTAMGHGRPRLSGLAGGNAAGLPARITRK